MMPNDCSSSERGAISVVLALHEEGLTVSGSREGGEVVANPTIESEEGEKGWHNN